MSRAHSQACQRSEEPAQNTIHGLPGCKRIMPGQRTRPNYAPTRHGEAPHGTGGDPGTHHEPMPAPDRRGSGISSLWVPIIRSSALTRGFALHPGTRNRYMMRYTRTQHRPASRHVNDHGRVSHGTHRHVNDHGRVSGRSTGCRKPQGGSRPAHRRESPHRGCEDRRDARQDPLSSCCWCCGRLR